MQHSSRTADPLQTENLADSQAIGGAPRRVLRGQLGAACLLALLLAAVPAAGQQLSDLDGGVEPDPQSNDPVARGKYILHAGGCITCHTGDDNGVPLAGGRTLETEFGNFYSPNITPHPDNGLGGWTQEQFRRAMREGIAPNGTLYYPAFPYASYAGMTDEDVDDLFAYLQSVQPVDRPAQDHELRFPYNRRGLLRAWRWMYFDRDGYVPQREGDEVYNRGSYLTNALGHCGECHTPRTRLGGMDMSEYMKGNPDLFGGRNAPDITQSGDVGGWSIGDLRFFLRSGFYPDFDVPGGGMGAVITEGTSYLTDDDLEAMVEFIMSLEE